MEEEKEPLDVLEYLDSSQDEQYFIENDSDDEMFGKKEDEMSETSDH